MAKYAEGNSANPATTDTPISSAQHNAAEAQLAAMLGPRVLNVMAIGDTSTWAKTSVAGTPYKWTTNNNSSFLRIPFSLYAGQKITSVSAVVSGATGALGGSIDFGYGAEGTNAVETAMDGGAANPWDTGGAAYGSATPYTLSTAPLPLVVTAGMEFYVSFYSNSNASTYTPTIWAVKVTVQFGN